MSVELRDGDSLELICLVNHVGEAATGLTFYAAIGKRRGIWPFDFEEVQGHAVRSALFSVSDDPGIGKIYTKTLLIPINVGGTGFGGISPGSEYEVYVKLDQAGWPPTPILEWYGPLDDITILEAVEPPPGEAVFSNLTVSYKPA